MTGPEHYRKAEEHLAEAAEAAPDTPWERSHLAAAQIHATLALAAATALIDGTPPSDSHTAYRAWKQVAGPRKQPRPCCRPNPHHVEEQL